MRLITGRWGGRSIEAPTGANTRPTTDMARQALFTMLRPYIVGARFMDVFSGSGALALEALSEGADFAVLIEKNRAAAKVIRSNMSKLGAEPSEALLIENDVYAAVNRLAADGVQSFDIIVLDPPYDLNLREPVIAAILEAGLAAEDAVIVAEHRSSDVCAEEISSAGRTFRAVKVKKYGEACFTLYREVFL